MEVPVFRIAILLCASALALQADSLAQTSTTLPLGFDRLPGNAALSMPVRWSWGRMQIIYDDEQLAPLDGLTITRLRLRRPNFFDEPAYPSVQRTFEISIGPAGRTAQTVHAQPDLNLPAAGQMTVVFGPAPVTIGGTAEAAAGDVVGATIVDVALTQPYTVQVTPGEHLLVDWKCVDTGLTVSSGAWVDAVRMPGAASLGLAVPVGQNGCGGFGGAPIANRLDVAEDSRHPAFGSETTLVLGNAQPSRQLWLLLGIDVHLMTIPAAFGAPLVNFPIPTPSGCRAWSPLDGILLSVGDTSPSGTFSYDLDFPANPAFQGIQLGFQAMILEDPPQLAFSSGLILWMDDVGLGGQIGTCLTLADETEATWDSFRGATPIVEFVH